MTSLNLNPNPSFAKPQGAAVILEDFVRESCATTLDPRPSCGPILLQLIQNRMTVLENPMLLVIQTMVAGHAHSPLKGHIQLTKPLE